VFVCNATRDLVAACCQLVVDPNMRSSLSTVLNGIGMCINIDGIVPTHLSCLKVAIRRRVALSVEM
jgi:hypothetical protein